jgi:hypothetical protein
MYPWAFEGLASLLEFQTTTPSPADKISCTCAKLRALNFLRFLEQHTSRSCVRHVNCSVRVTVPVALQHASMLASLKLTRLHIIHTRSHIGGACPACAGRRRRCV